VGEWVVGREGGREGGRKEWFVRWRAHIDERERRVES
jgi:hypothetical protein